MSKGKPLTQPADVHDEPRVTSQMTLPQVRDLQRKLKAYRRAVAKADWATFKVLRAELRASTPEFDDDFVSFLIQHNHSLPELVHAVHTR
jgi:hypothetical protein